MKKNGEQILKILYLAAASDGHIEESEMTMFDKIRHTYVPLAGFSENHVSMIAQRCFEELSSGTSQEDMIRDLSSRMDERVKNITFALATEVCAADFDISTDEESFLQVLSSSLGITEEVRKAVLTSAQIRYELTD